MKLRLHAVVVQSDEILGREIAGRAWGIRATASPARRRIEAADARLQPGGDVGERGPASVVEMEGDPIEGHACLIVRVGATELGLAFPRSKLKEFAQWMAAQELPEK